jgi:hypothetical protein
MTPASIMNFKTAVCFMINFVDVSYKHIEVLDVQDQSQLRQQRFVISSTSVGLRVLWTLTIIIEETNFTDVGSLSASVQSTIRGAVEDETFIRKLCAFPMFTNVSVTIEVSADYSVSQIHTPRPSGVPTAVPSTIFENTHLRYSDRTKSELHVGIVITGMILVCVFLPTSLFVRDYWQAQKDKVMLKKLANARIARMRYDAEEKIRCETFFEGQKLRRETEIRCRFELLDELKREKLLQNKLQKSITERNVCPAEIDIMNRKLDLIRIEQRLLRIEIAKLEEDIETSDSNFYKGKPVDLLLEKKYVTEYVAEQSQVVIDQFQGGLVNNSENISSLVALRHRPYLIRSLAPGKFLLIYVCNFRVLSHLLLIYICKLHWNLNTMFVCQVNFF